MLCSDVRDLIEPIAAGDTTPDGSLAEHLASCPACRAAVEDARRVDEWLRARAVPTPPAQFTSRTMGRIRHARWRSEQVLDLGFNVALSLVGLVIVVAIWLLLRRSGVPTVTDDAIALLETGVVTLARRIAPSLPLYAGATALVASALGIWWWAERDVSL